jgi:hypothetical protein
MSGGRFIGAALVLLGLLEIGRAAGIPVPGFLTHGVDAAVTPAGEDLTEVRARIDRALRRSNSRLDVSMRDRISSAVLRCHREQGLDPDLVLAVLLVESSARPYARSPKGAIGLMQVMPHMFEELGLPGNVAHIESNVEAGCLVLADNVRRLGEERGISAYFWGGSIQGDGYLRRVQSVLDKLARAPRPTTSPSDG